MKNLFLFALLFISSLCFAQDADKTVSITVSGSGKTQEEAKQSALRSAIEQAFGTFISSKTEILNDKILSDEIISISNGNIQKYEVLNESSLSENLWSVNLRAIVSINRLTNFVKSKGFSVEIKGGLFALNIKQQILNETAEHKIIFDLVSVLSDKLPSSFDYKISTSEPKSIDKQNLFFELNNQVDVVPNANFKVCYDYFISTLKSISMSDQEIEDYKKLNKDLYYVNVKTPEFSNGFALRNESSFKIVKLFSSLWKAYVSQFSVKNGSDTYSSISLIELDETSVNYLEFSNAINNSINFNFFSKNDIVATFKWKNKYTLSVIESMTEYSVAPYLNLNFKFKNGGILIDEENGHGIIFNPFSIGIESDWNVVVDKCDNFSNLNYTDWRLPNVEEMQIIYNFLNGNLKLFNFDLSFEEVDIDNSLVEKLPVQYQNLKKSALLKKHTSSRKFWTFTECKQDGSKIKKWDILNSVYIINETGSRDCVGKSIEDYRYPGLFKNNMSQISYNIIAVRNN
jgi:hypothetical protein